MLGLPARREGVEEPGEDPGKTERANAAVAGQTQGPEETATAGKLSEFDRLKWRYDYCTVPSCAEPVRVILRGFPLCQADALIYVTGAIKHMPEGVTLVITELP